MKNTLKRAAFGAVAMCVAAQAFAANPSPPTPMQVTSVSGMKASSPSAYFVITTSVAVTGCEAGFWLPASDSNYASYFDRVRSALGQRTTIVVSGDRDQLWSGATEKYCRIGQLQ